MCTIKLEHNGPFNRTQKDILQIREKLSRAYLLIDRAVRSSRLCR